MRFGIIAIVIYEDESLLCYMPDFDEYVEYIKETEFQNSYSGVILDAYLYWNILHFLKWRDEDLPNLDIVLSVLDIKYALEELDFILDISDIQMKLDYLVDLKLIKTVEKDLWVNIINIFTEDSVSYDFYKITERGKDILNQVDSFEHFARIIKAMPDLV
jgi:hypothetical protein